MAETRDYLTAILTQREEVMSLLNWLLKNRESLFCNRNRIGPAVPLYDFDDPECRELYGRQADIYNALASTLPDGVFKRFREWVAAQEDLERYLDTKLYVKGMVDGMVMLARWLNGQGQEAV